MDEPNRRHHIFGEPRHNLDRLVRLYGDELAAAQAITDAVETAFKSSQLPVDADGLFKQVFDISGVSVTVSGRVVNGIARIGTAWIAP